MQSRRVSCAIQGRTASSSRSESSRSKTRAKTSWKTSSASCWRQPEALDGDRVHVAGEPLDQLAPGFVVAVTAAGDEGGVGQLGGQL